MDSTENLVHALDFSGLLRLQSVGIVLFWGGGSKVNGAGLLLGIIVWGFVMKTCSCWS